MFGISQPTSHSPSKFIWFKGKALATQVRQEADVTSQPNKLAKNQVWQMKQMFGKNLAHITKAKQVCN